MASDEEEDLEALRLAALATLKKKPSVTEDAQPIPQLTSSGHSLHSSNSAWADDFPFDNVPFHDNQPVAQFQNRTWEQQQPTPPEYGQGSPTRYSQNNWRGQGARGSFQRPFMRGRGSFAPNPRGPFGQNQRLPFGQRMQFNRNQRPPFPQNQRLPFNPNQQPPFGQNPLQFPGGPPLGAGGGGNLIVINTLPEDGKQVPGPRFPGQRLPFLGRGGGPVNAGRGGAKTDGRQDGSLPPVESSSKPMLLRPQDKYCPSSDPAAAAQESAPVHRKKKDKFSRFDSSGSESDDESEDDSEDEQPSRRQSLAGKEEEEMNAASSNDDNNDNVTEDQPSKDIPDTEISISAINTSQINSDKEHDELEGDEFDEPVIDNLGDAEEPRAASEPELDEEEEEKLLASSPSKDSEMRSDPDLSVDSPTEVVRQVSVDGDEPPVTEESSASQQWRRGEKSGESDAESGSDNRSESGNESDTSSSGSSSSSATSSKDAAAKSDSDSDGSASGEKNAGSSPVRKDYDSGAQGSNPASDSESEGEKESIRRLPVKPKASASQRGRSPSPKKAQAPLTPEEQARLEARRRKFESSQEVKVTGNKRTISLKGIVPRTTKKVRPAQTQSSSMPLTNSAAGRSSMRTVQARTAEAKLTPSDSHRKHCRRRVSLEKPHADSEAENKSESEEDDNNEEEGSRSWMREANKTAARRKTLKVDQSLPGSGSYRGNSYRGSSRNGGYPRRGYDPPRDSRPEVHYSSSEDEDSDQDGDRKLISVVVPRPSAGTRPFSSHPRDKWDSARAAQPNRKRTANAISVDPRGDRGAVRKSKRFDDFKSLGSDGPETATISVVISDDPSSSKRSHSGGGRRSVHQRLGKGSSRQKESSSSRSNIRPLTKKQPASDDERPSNHNELDLRIRRIQQKNAAILRRQEEVRQDRELYG